VRNEQAGAFAADPKSALAALLRLLPADRPDPPDKGWGAFWDEARRDRLKSALPGTTHPSRS
jgi:hypothetical protein